MTILGLNYYFHDSTACLIKEGKLIAAIEEERLNRDKHTQAFPISAIDRCLKLAKMSYDDIDHIAVSIKPSTDWRRKLMYLLKHLGSFMLFIGHYLVNSYAKQWRFWIWTNETNSIIEQKPALARYRRSEGRQAAINTSIWSIRFDSVYRDD